MINNSKFIFLIIIPLLFLECTNQKQGKKFQTYPGLAKVDSLFHKEGETEPFSGTTESTYDNDQVFVRAEFKNGRLHGTYTGFYMDGTKMGITEYREGKKHGKAISWHENGVKASEAYFKEGVEHGILKIYYPNGQQRLEAEFENGVRVGTTIQWDSSGTMINNTSVRD